MYNYNFFFFVANRTLKEELQMAEKTKQDAITTYNTMCEKIKFTDSELNNVSATVCKLRSAQSECINLINELKCKLDSSEGISADVFVSI